MKGKNKKGFTMVETLVSIGMFGFISIALINIFVAAIKSQSRILQNQELMEQSSYALEYMGKIVRMAKKDVAGNCTGTANRNYGIGSDSINFLAYDSNDETYKCRQFLLESNVIKEKKSTDGSSSNLGTAVPITSSKVKVNGLTLAVTGDGSDTIQPKITVMIKMQSNISVADAPNITIQTSISQRQLDITI